MKSYEIKQKSVLRDIGSAMLKVTKYIFMGLEALFPSQLEPLDSHTQTSGFFLEKSFLKRNVGGHTLASCYTPFASLASISSHPVPSTNNLSCSKATNTHLEHSVNSMLIIYF